MKKQRKRLQLNRHTLRNLQPGQLTRANGGGDPVVVENTLTGITVGITANTTSEITRTLFTVNTLP